MLLGEDPVEVERLWHKMYMASVYYGRRGAAIQVISGIDIALWDIIGKATGQPVYKLLGGGYRDRVRAYASTLFRPESTAIEEACRGYLEQGFTAVKFGWGVFGQDPDRDECLVGAARRALGDKTNLLVNAGWYVDRSVKEAIQMVRRLAPRPTRIPPVPGGARERAQPPNQHNRFLRFPFDGIQDIISFTTDERRSSNAQSHPSSCPLPVPAAVRPGDRHRTPGGDR